MAQVAVVTGAFGALGRVVAHAAVEAGYEVAALDFAAAPAPGLDPKVMPLGGVDLADPSQALSAIEAVLVRFGRIDALFNIAGGFAWETIADGSIAAWERLHRLNLLTALNASKAALPHLVAAGGGAIVNVGANAALKAGVGMGAYAASKAGVARLTESLAQELAKQDITVNAVLPSIIDTPTNRADMPDADRATWVTPHALAEVIMFLLSPSSRAISGALIPVTRGG